MTVPNIPNNTSRIERIGLRQFRSYAQASLTCDPRPVCLVGSNGAGKTNLLEALSLLAVGRGLRQAKLTDLTRRNTQPHQGWSVSVRFGNAEQTRSLNMNLILDGDRPKRSVILDDAPASPADLAELFTLLWLTPAHDRVLAGARSERRRFFDRLILAHNPAHGKTSTDYEKAMRERNTLLGQTIHDPFWLDAIENRMAAHGATIASTRVNAIAALQDILDNTNTAFPSATIELKGPAEKLAGQGANVTDIANIIKTSLKRNRMIDTQAARTTCGVHRTDFNVTHAPSQTPAADCSTGERKALLLGMIIAAAHAWLREDTGRISLLLLDDAAAHLDSDGRNALCQQLTDLDAHCWISATDPDSLNGFGQHAQFFSIRDASILPLDHRQIHT